MLAPEYFDPRLREEFSHPEPARDLVSFSGSPVSSRQKGASPTIAPAATLPEFSVWEFGTREIHPNWNARGVVSPFWRLYLNDAPGAVLWHQGQCVPLDPNHIWLVAENLRFDCAVSRPTPHLWLHFSVRPSYAFDGSAPRCVEMDTTLRALVAELRALPMPPLCETARRRLHFGSHALLNATFARADVPAARPLPLNLAEVLRRIERAPRENLSNARLARLCGLSVGGFTRLFAGYIGQSPALYVRGVRLNHAARLLAFTDQSVEQIAEASGFPNRHYFTRMFARHAGCGPATFRKNHRMGSE